MFQIEIFDDESVTPQNVGDVMSGEGHVFFRDRKEKDIYEIQEKDFLYGTGLICSGVVVCGIRFR
ncbi:MAG: hypothetical protein LBP21_03190 [Synergistaceae bacterium]|jgi:hypothetical protein|nr:hypothetical protein [Synergistaceae bacterium]